MLTIMDSASNGAVYTTTDAAIRGKNITVKGGTISVNKIGGSAINGGGSINILGGTISAEGERSKAISSIGTRNISGDAVVEARGTECEAISNSALSGVGGIVNIKGGTVDSFGEESTTIANNTYNLTSRAGTINISGGMVRASGTISDNGQQSTAIKNGNGFNRNPGGTVTISGGTICAGDDGVAIENYQATLLINGTGVVRSTGNGIAIKSSGTLLGSAAELPKVVANVTIDAKALVEATGSDGIAICNYDKLDDYTGGQVIVNDGTVRASGVGGMAIYNGDLDNHVPAGDIKIHGGAIIATSPASTAIHNFGTVTVTGGTVLATDSLGTAIYNVPTATTVSATISGGSISSISGTAKNTAVPSKTLELYTFTIVGKANTAVDTFSLTPAYIYGTKDLVTDANSKLYVWLPTDTTYTTANIVIDEITYSGTITDKTATLTPPVEIIPVTGVRLNASIMSLYSNTSLKTGTLIATVNPLNATNKAVTWSSSNTAVATVANGIVTAVGNGTANITATTTDGGNTATCAVTVSTYSSSGGGGSSSSGGSTYYVSLPENYKGRTKFIGNVQVPDYTVEGRWSRTEAGTWQLHSKSGVAYTKSWIAAFNPYANVPKGQSAFDWFLFDTAGNMMTGWYTDEMGDTYYLNPIGDNTQGAMAVGWRIIDGKYYYFNQTPDGTRGKLLKETRTPDGYYVDKNGILIEKEK